MPRTVFGTIVNPAGVVLAGAHVKFDLPTPPPDATSTALLFGSSHTTTANSSGYFSTTLVPGIWIVWLTYQSNTPKRYTIEVPEGDGDSNILDLILPDEDGSPANFGYSRAQIDSLLAPLIAADGLCVTDKAFGAVGDYTGDMTTAGTGTDSRAAFQAALDAAATQGASFGSLVTGTSTRVKVPPGKYYISAPPSGLPSLVVPKRVEFDFSEAELFFDYPLRNYTANGITEPNPAWCAILVGANAGLRVGRMQSIWGADPTYGGQWYGMTLDAIRVYDSDRHFIEGGLIPHHIFNFRGAGIRYAGCWDAYLTNMSIANVCYGIVMGYVGTAFNQYQRYRTGGTPAESVSTNLHLHKVLCTNIYRTAVFVGAGNDWINPASANIFYGGLETPNVDYAAQGGPISMVQCSFENVAYGILFGKASIGSIYMSDIRSEECGDNSISLGVLYADCVNFSIDKMSWGVTGARNVTKAFYTGPNTTGVLIPSTFLRNDGVNCAPHIKNLFIANSSGGGALVRKGANARLPIVENYRCHSPTQMQDTDSSIYSIIYKNTGHGIESLSTTGMVPNGASETVNGSRTTFTFADGFTKVKPDRIVVDGVVLYETDVAGTNWTWNSTTGVVTLAVAPAKSIRAFF